MLTLKPHGCCLVCTAEFPSAVCNLSGWHDHKLPRVVRRHLAADMCDGCWDRFHWWSADQLRKARRKWQAVMAAPMTRNGDTHMHWGEADAEKTYGRFSRTALTEWLADQLGREAEAINKRIKAHQGKRFESWDKKSARRAWTRAAPDAPTSEALFRTD